MYVASCSLWKQLRVKVKGKTWLPPIRITIILHHFVQLPSETWCVDATCTDAFIHSGPWVMPTNKILITYFFWPCLMLLYPWMDERINIAAGVTLGKPITTETQKQPVQRLSNLCKVAKDSCTVPKSLIIYILYTQMCM